MSMGMRTILVIVFAAAVTAVTLFFRIPVPATGGYLNVGDIIIVFCGLFFGPIVGLLVGGLGSASADLFGGYASFAPVTLVVKGLEGLVPGLFTKKSEHKGLALVGAVLGGLCMVGGYFVGESLMPSVGPVAAKAELAGNSFQGLAGALGGYGLFVGVRAAFGGRGSGDEHAEEGG